MSSPVSNFLLQIAQKEIRLLNVDRSRSRSWKWLLKNSSRRGDPHGHGWSSQVLKANKSWSPTPMGASATVRQWPLQWAAIISRRVAATASTMTHHRRLRSCGTKKQFAAPAGFKTHRNLPFLITHFKDYSITLTLGGGGFVFLPFGETCFFPKFILESILSFVLLFRVVIDFVTMSASFITILGILSYQFKCTTQLIRQRLDYKKNKSNWNFMFRMWISPQWLGVRAMFEPFFFFFFFQILHGQWKRKRQAIINILG